MQAFIDLLREAYHTRDMARVDALAPCVDEQCAVIGTSLGEMGRGREAFLSLIRDDLDGWVDVDIQPAYDARPEGAYTLYTLRALARYHFTVNRQTYARYAGYMQDIRFSQAAPYAKAVKAIWQLDHLLSGKQKVRHTDDKPLVLSLLARDGLLRGAMFAFPMQKNHTHCWAGAEADMDAAYRADCAALAGDDALEEALLRTARPDGQRLVQARAQALGEVFFGCGLARNEEAQAEELMRCFEALDEETDPYRKVYTLRRRLGETLKLYANGDTQDIMVRFLGVREQGRVRVVCHSYPFYWILED